MAKLKINSQIVVGEVAKDDEHKYVISRVESSIGDYVSVQQHYINDDGEWCKGKGQWLPLELAEDIGAVIQEATER